GDWQNWLKNTYIKEAWFILKAGFVPVAGKIRKATKNLLPKWWAIILLCSIKGSTHLRTVFMAQHHHTAKMLRGLTMPIYRLPAIRLHRICHSNPYHYFCNQNNFSGRPYDLPF